MSTRKYAKLPTSSTMSTRKYANTK